MKKVSLPILFILTIIVSLTCYATVYMKTDSSGKITYTDVPSENAQSISVSAGNQVSSQLPPPPPPSVAAPVDGKNIQTLPAQPGTAPAQPDAAPENKPYQIFTILSPKEQETLQNENNVTVKLGIEPQLQPGDAVQVVVDGAPWGQPQKSDTVQIIQLDRGTHQIGALLINSAGNVLKESQTITIFIHRVNTNFKPS